MTNSFVSSSRGQMKIQQMAFVLLALMIFFAIVALFYITIRSGSLSSDVEALREEEAKEMVRKVSSWPEFAWSASDCAACIDLDKALVLMDNENYNDFWDVPFLQIEKIYPESEKKECNKQNYPDCSTMTFVKEEGFVAHSAFVALCRYDSESGSKCDLGKINLGFRSSE